MKVALITPGFGDPFYCQNCLRDGLGVMALRKQGIDAVHVPIYLPLGQGGDSGQKLFFPAVRVYLDSMFPAGRRLFRLLGPLLDNRSLLSYISKRSATTRAKGLGGLTHAMLRGSDPFWLGHFFPMLYWLKTDFKPDVVHLSNALLLGFAPAIKEHLGCAVVCSLQDENTWIEDLEPGEQDVCRVLMRQSGRHVDRFLPVSRSHMKLMAPYVERLSLKSTVVFPGVPLPKIKTGHGRGRGIGFLSRMCEEQGLGLLVDAFLDWVGPDTDPGVFLRVTGGYTRGDIPFLKRVQKKIHRHPHGHRVEWKPDVYRSGDEGFFQELRVLVHPARVAEGFSTPAAEAMVRGIPCLMPSRGGYPEIVRTVKGGILYETSPDARVETQALKKSLMKIMDPAWKHPVHPSVVQRKASNVFSLEQYGHGTARVYRASLKMVGENQ